MHHHPPSPQAWAWLTLRFSQQHGPPQALRSQSQLSAQKLCSQCFITSGHHVPLWSPMGPSATWRRINGNGVGLACPKPPNPSPALPHPHQADRTEVPFSIQAQLVQITLSVCSLMMLIIQQALPDAPLSLQQMPISTWALRPGALRWLRAACKDVRG